MLRFWFVFFCLSSLGFCGKLEVFRMVCFNFFPGISMNPFGSLNIKAVVVFYILFWYFRLRSFKCNSLIM